MIFTELRFFLFLTIVLSIYWGVRSHTVRKVWLLIASYGFYAAWDWRFTSLIAFSTVVDYVLGARIARTVRPANRNFYLILSLCTNLGLLGFFKYFNFFVGSFAEVLELVGLEANTNTLRIILPVGISFYTFQSMSYTIDIWRRTLKPTANFVDFALFVSFFPQLVAGPIVRASEFLPQLATRKTFDRVPVRSLLTLFLIGYFKKACVSDNLSPYVDSYFSDPQAFDNLSCQLAVALYSVQIYCDFSGYSDMAIATAGLLGFKLPKNFNAPYFSTSVTEFWRRWHISLSTWLRDYLYISLGGNRHGQTRTYINLTLTMVLGGLWHGASWNFVAWGLLHGIALMVNRGIQQAGIHLIPAGFWKVPVSVVMTLVTWWWVNLAWILFRAPDFESFFNIARSWLFFSATGNLSLWPWLSIHLALLAAIHYVFYRYRPQDQFSKLSPPTYAVAFGAVLAVVLALTSNNYQPFIYFQF